VIRDEKMAKHKGERLLIPVSLPCFNYKGEDDGPIRKTIIIAPIKIIECEGGSIQVIWDAAEEPSAKTKTADTPTQHKTKKANKNLKTKDPYKIAKTHNTQHNLSLIAAK